MNREMAIDFEIKFSETLFDIHYSKCFEMLYVGMYLFYLFASQANLAVQENRLTTAMLDLQNAQEELSAKQEELDIVQAEYEKAMREKQVNIVLQKRDCYRWLPHLL